MFLSAYKCPMASWKCPELFKTFWVPIYPPCSSRSFKKVERSVPRTAGPEPKQTWREMDQKQHRPREPEPRKNCVHVFWFVLEPVTGDGSMFEELDLDQNSNDLVTFFITREPELEGVLDLDWDPDLNSLEETIVWTRTVNSPVAKQNQFLYRIKRR